MRKTAGVISLSCGIVGLILALSLNFHAYQKYQEFAPWMTRFMGPDALVKIPLYARIGFALPGLFGAVMGSIGIKENQQLSVIGIILGLVSAVISIVPFWSYLV